MISTQGTDARAAARAFIQSHLTAILVALLIAGFILLWVMISTTGEAYRSSPEGRAEMAREADKSVIETDEGLVRASLRDSESAHFVGSQVVRRDGKEGVCGFVNSKNALGGMTGSQAFAVI